MNKSNHTKRNILFKIKFNLKKIFHRIRVGGAILMGKKPSKMSHLVESALYELRLMFIITTGVLGYTLFENITDDPNKSDLNVALVRINIAILLLIIFLIFRVLVKLHKKHSECNIHEHNKPHNYCFNTLPDKCKTCDHLKKPSFKKIDTPNG